MMTQAQLATASLNDIVFDGRNKEYGAYELRALYERHVKQALAWASVVLLLLLAYPVVSRMMADAFPVTVAKHTGEIILEDYHFDQPAIQPPVVEPPVTPRPPATQRTASIQFTPPVVDRDERVAGDPVPDQAVLATTNPGTVTIEGKPGTELVPNELEGEGKKVADVVAEKPYTYVEQMPELPGGGGAQAIVNAIQKAVRYPGRAVSSGIEGKVYATFVVNSLGEVTDIQITKGLGYGIDEETIRAIKTLPRFIPGRQNGRAVSVSYTVPITYKIQ